MTRSCRLDFVIKIIRCKEDRVKKVRFLIKKGRMSKYLGFWVSLCKYSYVFRRTLQNPSSFRVVVGRGWSGGMYGDPPSGGC